MSTWLSQSCSLSSSSQESIAPFSQVLQFQADMDGWISTRYQTRPKPGICFWQQRGKSLQNWEFGNQAANGSSYRILSISAAATRARPRPAPSTAPGPPCHLRQVPGTAVQHPRASGNTRSSLQGTPFPPCHSPLPDTATQGLSPAPRDWSWESGGDLQASSSTSQLLITVLLQFPVWEEIWDWLRGGLRMITLVIPRLVSHKRPECHCGL